MSDCISVPLFCLHMPFAVNGTAGNPTGKDTFELCRSFWLKPSCCYLAPLPTAWRRSPCTRTTRARLSRLALRTNIRCRLLGMNSVIPSPDCCPTVWADRSGFLSAFFALVGTHGLRTSGTIWMAVLMVQVARRGLTSTVPASCA